MRSTDNPGRVAGLCYLLLIVIGPLRLIYIPTKLFVDGNAPATVDNIAHQNTAAETLWGVWLFPLALLVYRSRFLPRFLGVWLALGGFAYVLLSLTGELL